MNKLNGLNFISIGGCTEIGMNLYAYVYDNQWILVDMGIGFCNGLGKELAVCDISILKNKKVLALFITHSHEDHVGAIPYLWDEIKCPVYAMNFAAEVIKDKLCEFQLEHEVPIIKVTTDREITVDPFTVRYINVAHSTPESCALAIKTPKGTIIHSGDWRIDSSPVIGEKTDETTLKNLGDAGVLALMCDSTNVFNDSPSISESVVRQNIIDIVLKNTKKRIIATCFSSNISRIETFCIAAQKSGRKIAVIGRSLKRMEKLGRRAGYLKNIPTFLDEKKAIELADHQVLFICTGSQGEENSSLHKIAYGNYKNLSFGKSDLLLFSSRIIPGNEKTVAAIHNEFIKSGVEVVNSDDCDIHASGHPSKTEIIKLYELTKPKIVIPIHGDAQHLAQQSQYARAFGVEFTLVPHDGAVINLDQTGPKITKSFEIKTLIVDGNRLIPQESSIYKMRENISNVGVVFASIIVTKSGGIKLSDLSALGVVDTHDYNTMKSLEKIINSEFQTSFSPIENKSTVDQNKIKREAEKIIRNIFMDEFSKKPVVVIHVL